MTEEIELLSILNAFGASALDIQLPISDWQHSEERKTKSELKRSRKLLRNKCCEERKQDFANYRVGV